VGNGPVRRRPVRLDLARRAVSRAFVRGRV
jgi:hypothetical protein